MSAGSLLERARTVLGNRYDVERELSADAGATLLLARDRSLKRLVAIKVIDRDAAGEELARRFQSKAHILAGISHPNIVAIHDLGEREGLLYYVRASPRGEPLSASLSRGALSSAEAIRLGLDLLG